MEKNLQERKLSAQQEQNKLSHLVEDILQKAKALGASQAEVAASLDDGLSASVRMGEIDTVEFNRDKGIGITVYFGHQKGSASSSDTTPEAIQATVEAACAIAKYSADDPHSGLADAELMAYDYPDLDLYHPWDLHPETAIAMARECESIGLQQDERINNSEGATVSTHESHRAYGNSHGFLGHYSATRHSIFCLLLAQQDGKMQRDYDYHTHRDANHLTGIDQIAKHAAQRTVKRLGAKPISTCKVPVIFAADIAGGLLGSFISAISGSKQYRKSTFLLDHLQQSVFPEFIDIFEAPHLPGELGSAPFDGEGVRTEKKPFISQGQLVSYVMGSYSARRLKMKSTGNAGGVFNLRINHSEYDLNQLCQQMGKGLLVTELMGHGVNLTTGDYSRGAFGYWVENGVISHPVEEITIAGNLRDMFQQLVHVGCDVDRRGNVHTGSWLIEQMTVAGT